ncbi:MAG: ComEC/Rec2 family competence protein [Candidatus Wallbacteria bacterium]|nr:ComEC/Rec2 family competence protein [Candidatus Wallbacteria bacterium]
MPFETAFFYSFCGLALGINLSLWQGLFGFSKHIFELIGLNTLILVIFSRNRNFSFLLPLTVFLLALLVGLNRSEISIECESIACRKFVAEECRFQAFALSFPSEINPGQSSFTVLLKREGHLLPSITKVVCSLRPFPFPGQILNGTCKASVGELLMHPFSSPGSLYRGLTEKRRFTLKKVVSKDTRVSIYFRKLIFASEVYLGGFGSDFFKSAILGIVQPNSILYGYFRDLGLMAYLAISGFNFSILLGALTLLNNGRKKMLLTMILPSLIYLILVGTPPAAVRSFIMMVIFLKTESLGAEKKSVSTLIASGWLQLLLFPGDAFSVGFYLSYLAMFSLVSVRSEIGVRAFILTSSRMQFQILPVSVMIFRELHPIAFISNLFFFPLLTIGTFTGYLLFQALLLPEFICRLIFQLFHLEMAILEPLLHWFVKISAGFDSGLTPVLAAVAVLSFAAYKSGFTIESRLGLALAVFLFFLPELQSCQSIVYELNGKTSGKTWMALSYGSADISGAVPLFTRSLGRKIEKFFRNPTIHRGKIIVSGFNGQRIPVAVLNCILADGGQVEVSLIKVSSK